MKKLIFAFALILLVLPFCPQARAQNVSIDFFYDNLNGGSWVEVGNYGYCWQPDVAVGDSTWRPYADGYWAYTDLGWTWVSYEDFGWATYHYGRWVRLADIGWVWVPGYHWGPAWVSWRYGGNYVGWAPLPPETEIVYESHPLTGHLDVEFDIGPACYNFVDVRYIGEPVLRSRIVPYQQNVTFVTQTVNVTNITYKNKTVYNYGPDLNVVNQYSSRPVQTLKLERQNVDVAAAAKSGGLTKVQGNALVVAAPLEINQPSAPPPPPNVKTKVEQPKIEKGWSVVGDENAKNQLKEKLKAENAKNIPPPTIGASTATAAGAGASVSPIPSGPSALPTSPFEKSKGKGKKGEQFPARAGASPAGAMISPGTSPAFPERGKGEGKNKSVVQFQPGAAASPMASPSAAGSASAPPEFGKRGKGKGREQFGAPAITPGPTAGAEEMGKPEGKRKGFERPNVGPTSGGATSPSESFNEPRGKHRAEGVNEPLSSGGGHGPAGPPPQGGVKKYEGKEKSAATATPGPQ
jgi:hypothetical protein